MRFTIYAVCEGDSFHDPVGGAKTFAEAYRAVKSWGDGTYYLCDSRDVGPDGFVREISVLNNIVTYRIPPTLNWHIAKV